MSSTTPITNTSFFRPTGISGCALWLDAADATSVVLSNTSNVTQWRDKSGSNNNAIQLTLANMPAYLNIPAISQNAIYFPSNSTNLTTINSNSTSGNSSRTIFVITYLPNSSSKVRIGTGTHATNTPASAFGIDQDPTTTRLFAPYLYTASDNILSASLTGLQCIYAYYDSGVSQIGGGYGFNTFLTKNTTLNTTASPWYFGLRPDNNGSLTSYICEFIQYNRTLTTADRQQVEGYLAWKWGIQRSLPANHPYYNNPQQSIYPYTVLRTIPQPETNLPAWSFFSPRSIPSCSLWLDAADPANNGIQPSSGTIISTWTDKSGNGRNATPAATGPQFQIVSGVPRMVFSGSNAMKCGAFLTSTNFSFFAVTGIMSGVAMGVWKREFGSFALFSDTVIRVGVNNSATYLANDITVSNTGPQIRALTLNSSTTAGSSFTLNGSVNGTNTTLTGTSANGNVTTCQRQVTIGGLDETTGTTGQFAGYIQEAIIFNVELTTAQRQQVEGYLALKWGLQSTLPTAHPTKANFLYPILPALPAVTQSVVPASINTNGRFTPTSLSGLSLWLDAADAATVRTSNTSVTQWNDKSGNTRNLTTVLSGSGTITYGSSSLVFSNTAYMFINTPVNLQNFTAFFIGRTLATSGTANNQTIFCARPTSGFSYNSTDGLGLYYDYALASTRQTRFYGTGNTAIQDSVTFVNPVLNCYTQNAAGSLSSFVYGINTSNVATTARTTTAQGFGVGAEASSSTGYSSSSTNNFRLCEIIVYSNVLTTQQRQQVEGYLAWKWGLRSSLPSTHPNAFMPP